MVNIIPTTESETTDRYAIVVAEWNRSITSKLLDGAVETLKEGGVADEQIDVAWVPGSWEIPVVVQRLAQKRQILQRHLSWCSYPWGNNAR